MNKKNRGIIEGDEKKTNFKQGTMMAELYLHRKSYAQHNEKQYIIVKIYRSFAIT